MSPNAKAALFAVLSALVAAGAALGFYPAPIVVPCPVCAECATPSPVVPDAPEASAPVVAPL